jgi:hypothetical protein
MKGILILAATLAVIGLGPGAVLGQSLPQQQSEDLIKEFSTTLQLMVMEQMQLNREETRKAMAKILQSSTWKQGAPQHSCCNSSGSKQWTLQHRFCNSTSKL